MGVPYSGNDMTSHPQYLVVRNERGSEMLDAVRPRLETYPTMSTGDRRPIVTQVIVRAWVGCNFAAPRHFEVARWARHGDWTDVVLLLSRSR